MCVHCMCAWCLRKSEGGGLSLEGELWMAVSHHCSALVSLGPLQVQPVLYTSEPTSQPHLSFFFCYCNKVTLTNAM